MEPNKPILTDEYQMVDAMQIFPRHNTMLTNEGLVERKSYVFYYDNYEECVEHVKQVSLKSGYSMISPMNDDEQQGNLKGRYIVTCSVDV